MNKNSQGMWGQSTAMFKLSYPYILSLESNQFLLTITLFQLFTGHKKHDVDNLNVFDSPK